MAWIETLFQREVTPVLEAGMGFAHQKQLVIANNIANADTPNFKARDIDFASVLAAQGGKGGAAAPVALARTDSLHISAEGLALAEPGLMYRTPSHPSIDQNTVDMQVEQAKYAENAVNFQASFTFLNSKFKGLVSALRGE